MNGSIFLLFCTINTKGLQLTCKTVHNNHTYSVPFMGVFKWYCYSCVTTRVIGLIINVFLVLAYFTSFCKKNSLMRSPWCVSPFKFSNKLIFAKFGINIVPLEATRNSILFSFLQSKRTKWRTHQLMSLE